MKALWKRSRSDRSGLPCGPKEMVALPSQPAGGPCQLKTAFRRLSSLQDPWLPRQVKQEPRQSGHAPAGPETTPHPSGYRRDGQLTFPGPCLFHGNSSICQRPASCSPAPLTVCFRLVSHVVILPFPRWIFKKTAPHSSVRNTSTACSSSLSNTWGWGCP